MPDDNDANETEEERFDRWYTERRKAEKDDADRKRKLKDKGLDDDTLDALGDALLGALDRRAAARRKAEEDADEPPSRESGKGNPFLKMLGG